MGQVTQAFPHLDLETIKQKVKLASSYWERQKWLVVDNALIDPRTSLQIARHCGVSQGFVGKVIQQYNRTGENGLSTPGKGGRRNCYLSWEEEKQLINEFKQTARRGQIATAIQIKLAYELKCGFPVPKTTIYRLLERHQWRKIVPRSCHPKLDPSKVALDSVFHPQQRTRAVVVVYRGQIVAERYAPGFSSRMPLPGWSMTKSVTNALVGILVQEGKLSLLDKNLMPQWNNGGDRRSQITLDGMLRMSSGLKFNESEGNPLGDLILMLFGRANAAVYAVNQPLEAAPDTKWQYSSGTTNIISGVIRKAIGSDTDYLAFPRRALFDRLGMSSAVIEPDALGTLVGSSFMHATARDWARFGLLYLQDGVWEGQRILPEGWVKYSRTPTKLAPKKNYGAHFWLMNIGTPSSQSQILMAQGFQDQYIAIIPSHQLVIVHLGKNENATSQQFIPQVLAAFAN